MTTAVRVDLMQFLNGPDVAPPADWIDAVTSRHADHARTQQLVDRAQVAIEQAEQSEQRIVALGAALAHQASIDRATGIIAATFNVDSGRAFECLVWLSEEARCPLPGLAECFVARVNPRSSDARNREHLVELLHELLESPHSLAS